MPKSLFYMTDGDWSALSSAEKDVIIERETENLIHACTMINAGLAVRYAGLIYFLPLCHDAYGEST